MRKPWRSLAILLFGGAVLVGGLVGDRLLALTDDARDHLKAYTELLSMAHDRYGDEVSYRDLVYASINGMLRDLDPHTSFLSKEAYDSMREKQQSTFYGLGIYVGTRNGQLTVITPIPGTPAHAKGMRAGDAITHIDGEPTDGMTQDEAISHLKGPKDTTVRVTLARPGMEDPLELEITRAEIPQNTVQYEYMLTDTTGYMSIRDFSRSTGSEVRRAIQKLKGEGMQDLILDLRFNGGGLLDQAIEVADQFVPGQSKIVETRGRIRSSFNAYHSSGAYEAIDVPLIVLVNGSSASASEILAGAIQDHDVGLIVGEPTWGKGLVQTVYALPYGAGVALTTARYYTPSGRLIQRDYTSYWDYYTQYDAEETAESVAQKAANENQEVFETDLGRKVYGGGGITPDYKVEQEDSADVVQILIGRSAFFKFAVELHNRKPITSPDWRPSDKDLEDFVDFVKGEELVDDTELDEAMADPENRRFALGRLRYEALTAALGLEAGHRALTEIDTQIQEAFKLLPEAAKLLRDRRLLKSEVAEFR